MFALYRASDQYCIYQEIWDQASGEVVQCETKPRNAIDRYSVTLMKGWFVIEHLPRTISRLCSFFWQQRVTIEKFSFLIFRFLEVSENIFTLKISGFTEIYLITCRKRGVQYVGQTGQPLHVRVNSHWYDITHQRTEEFPVAEHFNSGAHVELQYWSNARYKVNVF